MLFLLVCIHACVKEIWNVLWCSESLEITKIVLIFLIKFLTHNYLFIFLLTYPFVFVYLLVAICMVLHCFVDKARTVNRWRSDGMFHCCVCVCARVAWEVLVFFFPEVCFPLVVYLRRN